jgi:DNA (cytosine-5)-methyltransferase 1
MQVTVVVPQSRKRFFLVGSLNDEDDFLQEELDRNLADAPMSMRDYFGDSLGIDYYFAYQRSYSRPRRIQH